MHTRFFILLTGLAVALVTGGARPAAGEDKKETGSVQGRVTYKGKPLPEGRVTFHPAKGKPVVARIDADGKYLARKVPVGPVRVTVETEKPPQLKPEPQSRPSDPKAPPAKPTERPRLIIPIPAKYSRPETSGLTYTVKPGKQTHDITLE